MVIVTPSRAKYPPLLDWCTALADHGAGCLFGLPASAGPACHGLKRFHALYEGMASPRRLTCRVSWVPSVESRRCVFRMVERKSFVPLCLRRHSVHGVPSWGLAAGTIVGAWTLESPAACLISSKGGWLKILSRLRRPRSVQVSGSHKYIFRRFFLALLMCQWT